MPKSKRVRSRKGNAPHTNNTAHKHTKESLKNLPPSHRIRWNVNDWMSGVEGYKVAIMRYQDLCCALEYLDRSVNAVSPVEPFTIKSLPATVEGSPHTAFILCIVGEFEDEDLDFELLFQKLTGYLQAILMKGEWYQVQESKEPIEGAREFHFTGDYTDIGDSDKTRGLLYTTYYIGLRKLVYALRSLARCPYDAKSFLQVALHFSEPGRSPEILKSLVPYMEVRRRVVTARDRAELIQWLTDTEFSNACKSIALGWSKTSKAVLRLQAAMAKGDQREIQEVEDDLKDMGIGDISLLMRRISILLSTSFERNSE